MSNNKQSMKLYTEEQLINYLRNHYDIITTYDLQNIPHIELPSDEEVEQYLKSFPYTKHLDDGQYNDGVIVGAEMGIEWMRDKIQGGNK